MKADQGQAGGERAPYRGRLAPTPSGWLHLGHACTFTEAWRRARNLNGTLLMRMEDLDPHRCRPEYATGALEDLRWWGLDWDEGPDLGGPHAPYVQSQRFHHFRECLDRLAENGFAYPSPHSRREIAAARPGHSPVNGEPLFPPSLRPAKTGPAWKGGATSAPWRFQVPDGRVIRFHDAFRGDISFTAGRDFGDFLLWRREDVPAYELAVVVDDHLMDITEVVRGEDLLLSTARQILLYEAFGWKPPAWVHCPLIIDPDTGRRMSKTHRSMALRAFRAAGMPPGRPPETYFSLAPPKPPPMDDTDET